MNPRLSAPFACLLLLTLPGCQNLNRSMIFSTGTTLGVELSASPASDTPLQLVFGMKRAEVLIDPVLAGESADDIAPKAHSVLAKLAGRIEASGDAGITGAQWFASGAAADAIARQPSALAALTNDPFIAKAIGDAAAAQYGRAPDPRAQPVVDRLVQRYVRLRRPDDAAAIARFDAAAQSAGFDDFADFAFANPTADRARQIEQALRNTPEPR